MTPVDGLERRRAFCARLKAERERHGTTLSAIADTTKIKASLLEALERADVSHWPKGIYRRAFFRDYVAAFGLPPDQHAAEFQELFPDADDDLVKRPVWAIPSPAPAAPAVTPPPPAAPPAPASLASSLRLTLAHEEFSRWTAPLRTWPGIVTGHLARLRLAAAIDLALVAAVAFTVSAVSAVTVELAAAVLGAVYYSVGTALLGRTPACWWVLRATPVGHSVGTPAGAGVEASQRGVATQKTDLRKLVGQTLRTRSAVRDYVVRLSDSGSLMTGSQRRRDLAQLRRRRIESANSPADQGV